MPGSVGIRSFSWDWYVTYIDAVEFEEPLWIGTSGDHEYYTVLAAPQAPMSVPWTEVVEYECDWASGLSNAGGAAGAIVQGLFNWGLKYDITDGVPHFPEGAGSGNSNFYLTAFLQAKGTSSLCNCYDMGKAMKTFCNAIGCGTSYRYSSPFGYLNCIMPIGRVWTNNPFYPNLSSPYNIPIVEEDLSYPNRTKFGNHAFGSISDNIYDACLKVDTDSNPDAPPHSNNGNGNWAIGWGWNDYKVKVVDNNPAISTGYPSSYSDWSVY